MPDYKQTTVAGDKWNRFSRIVIDYPRNGAPSVLCVEQQVISLGENQEFVRDVGNLNFPFDPVGEFPLLDPITDEPTGQMVTGGQVYALVRSYVMNEAFKRDAAAAAEAAAAAAAAEAAAAAAAAAAAPPAAP